MSNIFYTLLSDQGYIQVHFCAPFLVFMRGLFLYDYVGDRT